MQPSRGKTRAHPDLDRDPPQKTLDLQLQKAVDEVTGTSKRNPNIRVEGEIVFCHILPYVMRYSHLMLMTDLLKLEKATPLVDIYYNLIKRYAGIPMKEVERIRGMGLYKDFHKEKDFNKTRMRLSSAALMRHGFNVEKLVQYIGGMHTGAHRNLKRIRWKLTPSVKPELLDQVIEIFEYGAPRVAKGKSSNKNFMGFLRYVTIVLVTDMLMNSRK